MIYASRMVHLTLCAYACTCFNVLTLDYLPTIKLMYFEHTPDHKLSWMKVFPLLFHCPASNDQHSRRWYSDHVITYIATKTLGKLTGHLQSQAWQLTLQVAWCLIWSCASNENAMVIHDTKCPYCDPVSLNNTNKLKLQRSNEITWMKHLQSNFILFGSVTDIQFHLQQLSVAGISHHEPQQMRFESVTGSTCLIYHCNGLLTHQLSQQLFPQDKWPSLALATYMQAGVICTDPYEKYSWHMCV